MRPNKCPTGYTKGLPASDKVTEIIENIFSLLDKKRISEKIDKPIDKALKNFQRITLKSPSNDQVHKILSAFYSAAYNNMHKIKKKSLAELLVLLDKNYRGRGINGYIGVLIDSARSEDGIRTVLYRLAHIIKEHEKDKYIRAIFTTYINPADWQLKCEIVKFIQNKYSNLVPKKILDCQPEQLVNELEHIIMLIFNSSLILSQITSVTVKNNRR